MLNQAKNTAPDLNAFATDSTGIGLYKLNETMVAQTLPDLPSAAMLPPHQPGKDPEFSITPEGGSAVTSSKLAYTDWNGLKWSAETSGGWLVQTCDSGPDCPQADSLIASFHYVDWSGIKWTASRFGGNFVSIKGAPASTDKPCPVDSATGVSPAGTVDTCLSYTSSSIPVKDETGANVTVSLTLPVAFTSPLEIHLTAGRDSVTDITASGIPAPAITQGSSSLTPGLFFSSAAPGLGQLICKSFAAPGTYSLRLNASNGVSKSLDQTIAVYVSPTLQITSPNTLSAFAYFPVHFIVTTVGYPAPALSIGSSVLPPGLTFTDNHNGTATISGVTTTDSLTSICLPQFAADCAITATSSAGTVMQPFSVNTNWPANLNVTLSTASFVAGIANSLRIPVTGALPGVPYLVNFYGRNPSWLNFQAAGNSAGVLSGTPPPGTSGTFTFHLGFSPAGELGVLEPSNFTLYVSNAPVFTSLNTAVFTVGTRGRFKSPPMAHL